MTWVKIDDRFSEHPKVISLSDAALRVHIYALCYAARNETDGYVGLAVLPILRARPRHIDELVGAGLWEKNGTGWAIHDYLAYNPSRDQSRAARERFREVRSAAGKKGAAKRWQT